MQVVNRMLRNILIASFFSMVGSIAYSQPLAIPEYVAGEHYQVLPNPVKVVADDKIEVMEVFWYGCSHCMAFEPLIAGWEKNLADDVAFARTPAVWQKIMRPHAALYYVAEALNAPHEIHMDIFKLLVANRKLDDVDQFAEIFAKYDITRDQFDSAYDSFGIKSKVSKAMKRAQKNYLVQGTPELIVNGRYRVAARMAGGQAEMLDVVNFLIDLERKR